MAQRQQTIITDDLEGGESPASETVTFALDGISYEIDLNEHNAKRLRDDFSTWLGHARKQRSGGGPRPARRARAAGSGQDTGAVRTWARENGYEISDRGRVPGKIVDAYHAANG